MKVWSSSTSDSSTSSSRDGQGDLGVREHADLLASRQEVLDLFEFLEFCD